MGNLCIIPARGGSKRIPRKNIKDFLGKPIIAYSIEAAIGSGLFDEVMVSSDDDEIIAVAKEYGANVPFRRSDKNSDDWATTADVIIEVLNNYMKKGNFFDHVCCLYPTAPMVKIDKLKESINYLIQGKFDVVFPIVSFDFPIWRGLQINEKGRSEFIWPEFARSRSQDLKPAFHDAGQFYWLDVAVFLKDEEILNSNTGNILISKMEVQDIDDSEDWNIAELKFKLLQNNDL